MSDTAPPTPAVSAAPSFRRHPAAAAAPSTRVTSDPSGGGLVIPEDKVVVWDDTMKQMVLKNRDEVTLTTWKSRIRNAAWKFWAGGPPLGA
ncbi:unnamed protein product [Ectocarpus fasciculatus]